MRIIGPSSPPLPISLFTFAVAVCNTKAATSRHTRFVRTHAAVDLLNHLCGETTAFTWHLTTTGSHAAVQGEHAAKGAGVI